MKLYVLSYDLKTPGRDYSPLYDAIKELGEWQHPLESTWVIATEEFDENSIYAHLKKTLEDRDLLLILEIKPESRQGWLAKSFWEWMNEKAKFI